VAQAESLPRIDSTEWRCVRLVDAGRMYVDVTNRHSDTRTDAWRARFGERLAINAVT
jgi:hypothetical protein